MLPSAGELTRSTNVVEFPVRNHHTERESLEREIVLELATADDVASGMTRVVERIRADSGAARAEWWTTGDDGAVELVAQQGAACGRRESFPLGSAGLFVLHGGRFDFAVYASSGRLQTNLPPPLGMPA